MLALGPPLLSWRTIKHWIFKFTNLRQNNIYIQCRKIHLTYQPQNPSKKTMFHNANSQYAQNVPFWVILQNIRPKTETNGKPTNGFPLPLPGWKRFSKALAKPFPLPLDWPAGHRWGRLRARWGRWKLGNLKHKIPRALRSRFTGYSPGPGSLVGFGFQETTSRVKSHVFPV